MYIIKPENEGTLIREYWKEKFRERPEPDWSKGLLKGSRKWIVENKATKMLKY